MTLCGGAALVLCLSVGLLAGQQRCSGASSAPSRSTGFTSAPATGTAWHFTTTKHSNRGTRASTNSLEQNPTGSSGLPGLRSEERGKASREWWSGCGWAGVGALETPGSVSREGSGRAAGVLPPLCCLPRAGCKFPAIWAWLGASDTELLRAQGSCCSP